MKILIADDHPVFRNGIKHLVMSMEIVLNIDEAGEGHEVLEKIEKNNYDLVILDISMPGISGLDILKIMKDRKETAHILILSMHSEEQYAKRAIKLGASGYLCKNSVNDELEFAIKKIASGGKYISHTMAEKIVFENTGDLNKSLHETLSGREFQVLCMIAQGKSIKDIAAELFLSDKTISTYRTRILNKMGLKNNIELVHYAIKNNLIE